MFANWFCQFPSVPLVQCVDSLKYNMLCCFLDIVNQAMIVIAALTSSWNVRLPHHSNFTHLQSPLATPIKLDSSSVTPAACNQCRGDLKESAVLAWNLWIVSRPEASLNTNVVPSPNIAMSERLLFRFWICAKALNFLLGHLAWCLLLHSWCQGACRFFHLLWCLAACCFFHHLWCLDVPDVHYDSTHILMAQGSYCNGHNCHIYVMTRLYSHGVYQLCHMCVKHWCWLFG